MSLRRPDHRGRVRVRLLLTGAALLALAVTAWISLRPSAEPAAPMVCETDDTSHTSPGFVTPPADAALHALDGRPVMLRSLGGEALTVLIFCSARCPCSDGYAGRLDTLLRKYGGRGVRFAGIQANAGESADDMKAYIRRRKWPLPVFRDERQAVADMLGARVTPEAFVFDTGWRLRYQGRIDDDKGGHAVSDASLALALDTLLAGRPLTVREKAGLGCAIVRSEH